jgi:hypothetical protein
MLWVEFKISIEITTLQLLQNLKLECWIAQCSKGLPGTNTLAHWPPLLVMKKIKGYAHVQIRRAVKAYSAFFD